MNTRIQKLLTHIARSAKNMARRIDQRQHCSWQGDLLLWASILPFLKQQLLVANTKPPYRIPHKSHNTPMAYPKMPLNIVDCKNIPRFIYYNIYTHIHIIYLCTVILFVYNYVGRERESYTPIMLVGNVVSSSVLLQIIQRIYSYSVISLNHRVVRDIVSLKHTSP